MGQQIQGSLQHIEIDVTGTGSDYDDLVCLRTSSLNTSMDATNEQTNCGVLTSVSEPLMSVDFDAICEITPTADQVSYEALLSAMVNKTLIKVRVQNPTVTGTSAGQAYYHQFSGYITDLTWNQSTTEFINFSGTIQSTGSLDVDPAAPNY
jgi:hypothetical protein